jgi:hypothetical protein
MTISSEFNDACLEKTVEKFLQTMIVSNKEKIIIEIKNQLAVLNDMTLDKSMKAEIAKQISNNLELETKSTCTFWCGKKKITSLVFDARKFADTLTKTFHKRKNKP